MLFPLVARAFGLLAAIVGILVVKTREDADPMAALNRGYAVTAILAIAGFGVATHWLLANPAAPNAWWMFFLCGVIGVLTSWAFVWITQYYTEYRYRPVREIAHASLTGPATNIISGIAIGLECTLLPTLTISCRHPLLLRARRGGDRPRRARRSAGLPRPSSRTSAPGSGRSPASWRGPRSPTTPGASTS